MCTLSVHSLNLSGMLLPWEMHRESSERVYLVCQSESLKWFNHSYEAILISLDCLRKAASFLASLGGKEIQFCSSSVKVGFELPPAASR